MRAEMQQQASPIRFQQHPRESKCEDLTRQETDRHTIVGKKGELHNFTWGNLLQFGDSNVTKN